MKEDRPCNLLDQYGQYGKTISDCRQDELNVILAKEVDAGFDVKAECGDVAEGSGTECTHSFPKCRSKVILL